MADRQKDSGKRPPLPARIDDGLDSPLDGRLLVNVVCQIHHREIAHIRRSAEGRLWIAQYGAPGGGLGDVRGDGPRIRSARVTFASVVGEAQRHAERAWCDKCQELRSIPMGEFRRAVSRADGKDSTVRLAV